MAWIIVFSVLAVIVLLLFFTPFCVVFSYGNNNGGKVKIKFLFTVFSAPRKKKEKKVPAPEKSEIKNEGKKPREKKDIKEILRLAKGLIPVLGDFCKHVVIPEIEINILHGSGDAAETAMRYGEINGGVYSLLSLIKNVFKVKKQHVNIVPDFKEEKTEYLIKGKATVYGIYVLISAVKAVKVFLKTQEEKE